LACRGEWLGVWRGRGRVGWTRAVGVRGERRRRREVSSPVESLPPSLHLYGPSSFVLSFPHFHSCNDMIHAQRHNGFHSSWLFFRILSAQLSREQLQYDARQPTRERVLLSRSFGATDCRRRVESIGTMQKARDGWEGRKGEEGSDDSSPSPSSLDGFVNPFNTCVCAK
jgi:hypothetical protein